MSSATPLLLVLVFFLRSTVALGLNNGISLTPPMGWNPFNAFGCNTSESQYRAAVDSLIKFGLKDLGYKYLNLDCGWQSDQRSSSGQFTWNATRIPSGIPALGNYIHSQGLLFGLYSDAGYYSCDQAGGWEHWLGSGGNEKSDAITFASWGADYLKYGSCFVVSNSDFIDFNPSIQEETLYGVMRDALNSTGRPIVYAINDWGVQDPAHWGSALANTWRISNDVGPSFADLRRVINQLVPIAASSKPGGWNDLDLLQVGNRGLTKAEWGMQFAFWAAAKSPLLVSTDLTTISKEALSVLSNKQLIAVNQDLLGQSIQFQRRYTDDFDVWAGPLADGSTVAMLLNWKDENRQITFNLSDVGLVSAELTDLWNGTKIGNVKTSYTAVADAHAALVYKLANTVAAPLNNVTWWGADDPSNVFAGGASLRAIDEYTKVASNIGYGGTVTITGIDVGEPGGTRLVTLAYVNADYTFTNTDCPNCRWVEVSVNGKPPVVVETPLSGQNWTVIFPNYLLSLDGFHAGPGNNVKFGNPNGWAPDIFNIGIMM